MIYYFQQIWQKDIIIQGLTWFLENLISFDPRICRNSDLVALMIVLIITIRETSSSNCFCRKLIAKIIKKRRGHLIYIFRLI